MPPPDIMSPAEARPLPAVPPPPAPVRNVYACLVHEQPDCVLDLVLNLRHHDPVSPIILYNGGSRADLLDRPDLWRRLGVVVHPAPRPMAWGYLHGFALDCMRLALDLFAFDTLTIVDSDQLSLRPGYCEHLAGTLAEHPGTGLLGAVIGPHGRHSASPPAQRVWAEYELWRPFLRRCAQGEEACVHTLFWPSTVFTAAAARDLCELWAADAGLRAALGRTKAWPTEEVILPTLVAMLGHGLRQNPCSYEYVRFRKNYTARQLAQALARPDAFWMHPVPRQMAHPLRAGLRAHAGHYGEGAMLGPVAPRAPQATAAGGRPLLSMADILARMRPISGWLDEGEAELLVAGLAKVAADLPGPHQVVEVGSYRGRATVVLGQALRCLSPGSRVHAIDPHDGVVSTQEGRLKPTGPTLAAFRRNIAAAGLDGVVETVRARAPEVRWDQPVSFLLVDGWHDHASVRADFEAFQPRLRAGAIIAFHDYASYFPGVTRFVDELLGRAGYAKVAVRGSMVLVRFAGPAGDGP